MKEVKQINKHLLELEEEIEKYMSNRDKNPYKNYKERIRTLTQELTQFRPQAQSSVAKKAEFNDRIAKLWLNFEKRSDKPASAPNRGGEAAARSTADGATAAAATNPDDDERKEYIRLFTNELRSVMEAEVEALIGNKTLVEKDTILQYLQNKIMPTEIQSFEKKKLQWSEFKMTEKIRERAQKFSSSTIKKK